MGGIEEVCHTREGWHAASNGQRRLWLAEPGVGGTNGDRSTDTRKPGREVNSSREIRCSQGEGGGKEDEPKTITKRESEEAVERKARGGGGTQIDQQGIDIFDRSQPSV